MYSAQQDSGTVATPIFGRGGQDHLSRLVHHQRFRNRAHYSRSGRPELSLRHRLVRIDSAHQQESPARRSTSSSARRSTARAGRRRWAFRRFDPQDVLSGDAVSAGHARQGHALGDGESGPDAGRRAAKLEPRPPATRRARRADQPSARWHFRPRMRKSIWAGTSNGLIQLTRDGGAHWNNVGSAGSAARAARCRRDGSIAQRSRPRLRHRGRRRRWRRRCRGRALRRASTAPTTTARTGSWSNAGLPNSAAHAIREDPENRNLVFAALDAGVFVSFNGGDRVAVAATESAGRLLPRSRHRAERSGRGHLRPRAVGHRRHQPAARTGRRRRPQVSSRTRTCSPPRPPCACSGTPTPTRR